MSARLACKATPMFPALKLVVNHTMTVLMMRNVTFLPHHQGKGSVSDFVSHLPVPKGLAVKQRTTKKYAPAITPCKEMATLLVYHVSCSLSNKLGMNFGRSSKTSAFYFAQHANHTLSQNVELMLIALQSWPASEKNVKTHVSLATHVRPVKPAW